MIRQWVQGQNLRPRLFIEPFAGGGIASLTVAFENLSDKCLLVELDDEIAAVWQTIIYGDALGLANRILDFELSSSTAREVVDGTPSTTEEMAFRTILRNRISHGGVLAPGAGILRNGENGRGIHSRWYPETLAKRIRDIVEFRHRLSFIQGDGFETLSKHLGDASSLFFIDPPYTASKKKAGTRLYKHHEIDHARLFEMVADSKAPFLITYDESEEIRHLCRNYDLECRKVLMRNTHHLKRYELLICDDFSWFRPNRTSEQSRLFSP
jgi:DNA adenine methylase